MRHLARVGLAAASLLVLAACSSAPSDEAKTLQVVAVQSPMTDVVEAAATAIGDGYEIELVQVSDYVTVNTMLAAGDVDANFSQHVPYMELFNAGNDADLTGVQPVYNFTIAFYSKEYADIADLPQGAKVAIADDASNRGRALKLLADAGLISLDSAVDPYASDVGDIVDNPLELEFLQVGIPLLNAAYDEADLVFQWPSHIAALGLNPHDHGLITELDDRFALYLVVNGKDADSEATQALKAAFASDAVREVIEANETIEVAF
ncbi:MAG: D-methionine-binding lipoprotein MetQ [Actinomycetales bacterium]|nr:D-methionine-binding lipoprotein MetQ [Actinomycetales bacterium]